MREARCTCVGHEPPVGESESCQSKKSSDKDPKHRGGCRKESKKYIPGNDPNLYRDISLVQIQPSYRSKRTSLSRNGWFIFLYPDHIPVSLVSTLSRWNPLHQVIVLTDKKYLLQVIFIDYYLMEILRRFFSIYLWMRIVLTWLRSHQRGIWLNDIIQDIFLNIWEGNITYGLDRRDLFLKKNLLTVSLYAEGEIWTPEAQSASSFRGYRLPGLDYLGTRFRYFSCQFL